MTRLRELELQKKALFAEAQIVSKCLYDYMSNSKEHSFDSEIASEESCRITTILSEYEDCSLEEKLIREQQQGKDKVKQPYTGSGHKM